MSRAILASGILLGAVALIVTGNGDWMIPYGFASWFLWDAAT